MVDEAVESIPEEFQQYLENVFIEVCPQPTREAIGKEPMKDWRNLLGLYSGVPVLDKSVDAPIEWPDRIFIFQKNIESMCRTEDDVVHEVRTTILHEIGHHFGLDEDDLDRLGYR